MSGTPIKVVFDCPNGFVTDLAVDGKSLEVRTEGMAPWNLPRYGVWKWQPHRRRHEVVLTTDDLNEAKAAAQS